MGRRYRFRQDTFHRSCPLGINVNTICPGYIETKRLDQVFTSSGAPDAMRGKPASEIPMGRIDTVADIANIVAFIVSPKGRYITETAVQVDGGLLRAVR